MTKTERKVRQARNIRRFIALLLGVGGLAGLCLGLWTLAKILFYRSQPIFTVLTLIFVLLSAVFGTCVWTGLALWKEKPRAKGWAMILIALQMPLLTLPGFSYEFFTGLLLSVVYDHAANTLGANFELASNLSFKLSSQIEDWTIGVNLIAVTGLVLLLRLPKENGMPTISHPISTPLNPQDLPPNPQI